MAHAHTIEANPHWLPLNPPSSLKAIPGERGWPFVGNTFEVLKDPLAFTRKMVAKHGPVYRNNSFGGDSVVLLGPDANELVLFDKEKNFSSEQGWGPVLNLVFPRGLMLMDFEKHRADRKALTLDLAATSFLGVPLGDEAAKINQAFVDEVQASVSPIRSPLPGTSMRRGVKARDYLVDFFNREIPARRDGTGQDFFSQFCRATDESGAPLPADAIVDHMNFLMMAAHDTITSSATSMLLLLGRNPEWQERLRAEVADLGSNDGTVPYGQLDRLVLTEYAFKESLRLMPPVPSIPRRALREFEFGGYRIPAGTFVGVNTAYTHHMPELWPDPERFDPMRFSPEASKGRHRFAWVPFGGGAHMCIGLHFATMQIRILMAQLLSRYRIELAPGAGDEWQIFPIPKPKDGLPVTFVPV